MIISMIKDLWWDLAHGDGWDRVLAFGTLVLILASVVCVVAMPVLLVQAHREREALLAEGCEVVDHRSEFAGFMHVGKSLVPRYRTIETWSCPDGRRFER